MSTETLLPLVIHKLRQHLYFHDRPFFDPLRADRQRNLSRALVERL